MLKKIMFGVLLSALVLITISNAQTYLLNESFTSTTFPPAGWTVYNFTGGKKWERDVHHYNTSPACARCDKDGSSPNNDWLITPRLGPITSNDSLIFYHRVKNATKVESLLVRVSKNPDVGDTSNYNIIKLISTTAPTYIREALSLSAFTGETIYIAFYYCARDKEGIRIDDVQVARFINYTVTFTETGLPSGTSWTVTWNGTPYSSTTNTITISNVSAGTYNWSVSSPISGGAGVQYVASPTSGSMDVPSQTSQSITYTTQYYLTVNSVYSTVGGEGWYDENATAYASVTDSIVDGGIGTRYVFSGWTGDASGTNLVSEPITMDGPKTATATWTTQYLLTVNIEGNGTVDKDPDQEWYDSGASVELTAIPAEGWHFDSWSGDLSGSNNPEDLTIDGPKTVTANFEINTYTLTVNVFGNGSVDLEPATGPYEHGTWVKLTANPDPYWIFNSWGGDLAGDNNPDSIYMDGDKSVDAYFYLHDIEVTSIPQPGASVPICTPFAPTIEVTNNSYPTTIEQCTLFVYIWRYPVNIESVCRISRAAESVLVYADTIEVALDPGSNYITLSNWHPQYADLTWLTNPTYHIIYAEVRMDGDGNPTNNDYTKHFRVTGIENDLQVNGATLLRGAVVVTGDTIPKGVTFNTMSVVSNNSPTKRLLLRSYLKIIRVKTNATIYSRYLDYRLNPQSYVCLSYSAGVVFQDTGLYKMTTWIQTAAGVDVTPNNNQYERYFYVKYMSTNPQDEEAEITSSEYYLFNSSPNPFSNMTEIRWQIPKQSKVRIAIYNALGQHIKTLVDGTYETGSYQVSWNRQDNLGRRVASGIYFYELRTDEWFSRKKMIITE